MHKRGLPMAAPRHASRALGADVRIKSSTYGSSPGGKTEIRRALNKQLESARFWRLSVRIRNATQNVQRSTPKDLAGGQVCGNSSGGGPHALGA
jgi:hypothetical protein